MTVAELRAALAQYHDDMPVKVFNCDLGVHEDPKLEQVSTWTEPGTWDDKPGPVLEIDRC